ncbi:response regulator transcription factor [Halocola ammonii]
MSEKPRILVVEDESSIREMLQLNLDLEGYDVVLAKTGGEALERLRQQKFSAAILDVMLPEVDGFTICKTIRLEGNTTPVLFLTAKSSGPDRVEGLKIGGDDYLSKPFHLEELLLRVQKLVARSGESEGKKLSDLEEFSFGENNYVNFKHYEIRDKEGREQEISKKEMMMLKLLIHEKNKVVSREEILETVWGYNVYPSTRTIDNFILAFRKYFEPDPKQPIHFHSVRGVGYKFTP